MNCDGSCTQILSFKNAQVEHMLSEVPAYDDDGDVDDSGEGGEGMVEAVSRALPSNMGRVVRENPNEVPGRR